MVAVLGAASIAAHAQTASIDLPAQPLAKALAALASRSGANILAPDALVANRTSPALTGKLTVREALEQLLRGTRLQVQQLDAHTYVIVAPPTPAPAPATPNQAANSGPVAVLPAITVTDWARGRDDGFVATSTSSATRTDTPIGQTPQSIQVVTQAQLKSQQVQSVTDALNGIGGVIVSNIGDGSPKVSIRGFQAATMTNGSNDLGNGTSNPLNTPMAGIGNIEVLKGADSILAGAIAPGGVVNVNLKQPTATPVHELTFQTGSYGNLLTSVDLGGPLTQDKSLTYRFVLSGERTNDSYGYGYGGNKNLYIAPSLGWKSGGTEVVVGYSHALTDLPLTPETLITPGGPLPLSGQFSPLGSTLIQSDSLYVNFKQHLGKYFAFESKTQYTASRISTDNFYTPDWLISPGIASYYGFAGISHPYGVDTDQHLEATFSIGPVKQKILGGFDYQVYWRDTNSSASMPTSAPFPNPVLPPISGPFSYNDAGKSYSDNAYLQDQITWGRLHVLASIAHGASWSPGSKSQSAWTPNIGALYQLTDSVAIYGSVLRSFVPQRYLLLGGGSAPPLTGRSVEAGFKFNFFDDRLSVTTDVYRAAETNVATYIPGTAFYVLMGGQVTRGAELSVTGRLFPGLNVSANYTYSNQVAAIEDASEVPRHSGSLWMTYDLQGERWHGWGAGVGIEARSGYQNSSFGEYRVPGQMKTDLSVYYQAKQWSAALGVKNIFNRTLYGSQSLPEFALPLQAGRLVFLTGHYNI